MSGSPSWIRGAFWLSLLLGSAACGRGTDHGGHHGGHLGGHHGGHLGGHHSPIIFNDFCAMKDESGPCKAVKERFFFDVNTGSCERFQYGGCRGNANNFETMEECEEACVFSDTKDPCPLPEAPGPCRGLVRRFFFDSRTRQCRHFYYGGCFGNANNFRSLADCQARCLSPDEAVADVRKPAVTRPTAAAEELSDSEPQVQLNASQTDSSASEICFRPVDGGGGGGGCGGGGGAVRRFAFNPAAKRCQAFSYSGCGGNQNNFLSRKHCYHKCIKGQKGSRKGMIRIRKKNIHSIVNRGD